MSTSPRVADPSETALPMRALTRAGYAGFVLIGWDSVIVPSLIRSIERDFHTSDADFALFYFLSALVYACGSFGGGFLTERLGRKTVLISAGALLGIGLAGQGLAPTWWLLLLAGIPVNWGAGAIDGGTNGLFLDLFRASRAGALNLLHVFFSAGALVAPFAIGLMLTGGLSWRAIPLFTAIMCLPYVFALASASMPSGRHKGQPRSENEGDSVSASPSSLLPFWGLAASIGFCVAIEMSVSAWVVRLLAGSPIAVATAVLSIYWAGLAAGRLLSNRFADRFDYTTFTIVCMVMNAMALVAALASPWLPLAAACFALTGLFSGPIYPMIIAIGGNIYSERLAALSGSLSAAAVVGSLVYPPLIGVMASTIGIRGGMLGAALLAIPEVVGVIVARARARPVRRS